LNGTINANGFSTTAFFEFGLDTSYGNATAADQSPVIGSTDTAVSKTISGLTLGVTYHYRLGGTNADGTAYGADETFTTTAPAPEMDVLGIGNSIADGDTTPSTFDATDFGIVDLTSGDAYALFTIRNTGTADLTLNGMPIVELSGLHPADFSVTAQPTTPVASGGGSTSFTIRFDPSATGTRSAMVSIANNDSNENPYTFNIQGTGTNVWSLNVTKNGNGSGTVTSTPTGIDCGGDCDEVYSQGTAVTLTATPEAGMSFDGWSGGGCSSTADCTITMNAAVTVTATFNNPEADFDSDGAPDTDEHGPNADDTGYDGNSDGTADWRQNNVVSSPTWDGEKYITLYVTAPAAIGGLTLDAGLTGGRTLYPYGAFSFNIDNVGAGKAVILTLKLENDAKPDTYVKLGPTPSNPTDHVYRFLYNGVTGAEIDGNMVTLHFVDGERGDHDLDGTNGQITENLGGPGYSRSGSSSDGSSGCFIDAAAFDSPIETYHE
jgi:hypothetical protein